MGSEMTSEPQLEVRGVERSFGGVKALNGMDLTLGAGESAALIGPNGSGKSTLVNVVTRMVDADRGTIRVGGVDVTRERRHRMAAHGVARTFQHVRLIPELTLRENAAVGAIYRDIGRFAGEVRSWLGARVRHVDRAAAESALDLMEVPASQRDRTPPEVPFALQRQTEMARALASGPRVVLLDEPAAGMNPAEVEMLLRLLGAINERETATLLIDHNIEFVMRAASTVTVINRGTRIAWGSAESVRKDPAVIEAYLGARRAAEVENLS
jgi:ABC-type branched-subunit amino acid transport system ATPase component